jgi:NF-X1-type zinc finger protein NFXL1
VLAACFCKKSKPLPKRCSDKLWSCASTCGGTLPCGKHKCEDNCHPDECEPCPRTSKQFCLCRSSSREQPCATPNWQCEKVQLTKYATLVFITQCSQVCGKLLSCGNHKCEDTCHRPGQCGPCPRSGARSCPCGKSETQNLPCTADVAPCGSTCGKKLSCKAHACLERCHKEKCGNVRRLEFIYKIAQFNFVLAVFAGFSEIMSMRTSRERAALSKRIHMRG